MDHTKGLTVTNGPPRSEKERAIDNCVSKTQHKPDAQAAPSRALQAYIGGRLHWLPC